MSDAKESAQSGGESAEPTIEANGLSKFYGDFAAARDVTFKVRKGEVAAFLGPNGAGKSTTMKLLTGYLAPSAGTARVAGFDMQSQRLEGAKRLGYLPENGPLYPDMTPRAFLRFFAEARGMDQARARDRIEAVIDLCALKAVLGKPIGKLSKGYRQRVGMAQVLLHEPDVLILDEPTAGLDPNQIREVRKLIRKLGETKTILLSTHILQEVSAMCTRVIFINEGEIVFDGPQDELLASQPDMDQRFYELTSPAAAVHA
jgi:ABC-2 type transport system ATP-binding protein